jgi:hypothetical protein
MALVGGALAAWLGGGVLSLGSLVGFYTVFGIAARNGILMINHFQHLEQRGGERFGPRSSCAARQERLSPILMTTLATGLALVPLVVCGDVPGHEIEHPLAVVVVGGLVTSTLLNLFVVPSLYLRFGRANRQATPLRGAVHSDIDLIRSTSRRVSHKEDRVIRRRRIGLKLVKARLNAVAAVASVAALLLVAAACGESRSQHGVPARRRRPRGSRRGDFSRASFDHSTVVDNPWLPLTPGRMLVFEGHHLRGRGPESRTAWSRRSPTSSSRSRAYATSSSGAGLARRHTRRGGARLLRAGQRRQRMAPWRVSGGVRGREDRRHSRLDPRRRGSDGRDRDDRAPAARCR